MRILVVEDETRIRKGICDLLARFFPQHEVVGSVENGEDGCALFEAERPDLIITDVKMPVMDGLEMLDVLNRRNWKYKAIVLSAYAEFSYAQQAMRYGVSAYLVKPLVVGDFIQAINEMEAALQEEASSENPDALGKLDYVLFGLLFGSLKLDDSLSDFLKDKYEILPDTRFVELHIYFDRDMTEQQPEKNDIVSLLHNTPGLHSCLLVPPKENKLLAVIYHCDDVCMLERRIQHGILDVAARYSQKSWNVGWIVAHGINALKSSYQTLSHHMDWNISFGGNVLISYPKILQVQTAVCVYPIAVENRMKAAISGLDRARALASVREFQAYFASGAIYPPGEIKDCFVRFLWALLNIAKEVGVLSAPVDQQDILRKIMESVSRAELWEVVEEVSGLLIEKETDIAHTGSLSCNIFKAQSMVAEYYQSGITLEEIASRLCITPEYLSIQFHRETGIKFSDYIRAFRIAKAKELLLGSRLKVFEVALRVGYTDAKYFSRVFKDCTGQLPADYRRTHK